MRSMLFIFLFMILAIVAILVHVARADAADVDTSVAIKTASAQMATNAVANFDRWVIDMATKRLAKGEVSKGGKDVFTYTFGNVSGNFYYYDTCVSSTATLYLYASQNFLNGLPAETYSSVELYVNNWNYCIWEATNYHGWDGNLQSGLDLNSLNQMSASFVKTMTMTDDSGASFPITLTVALGFTGGDLMEKWSGNGTYWRPDYDSESKWHGKSKWSSTTGTLQIMKTTFVPFGGTNGSMVLGDGKTIAKYH